MPTESPSPRSPSKPKIPAYRLHKASGRAVVTLAGRDHYLGPHGSPESRAEYDRLIAKWLTTGRTLEPAAESAPVVLVGQILLGFVNHCEQRFKHRRRYRENIYRVKAAIKPVRKLYGPHPATAFGPLALEAVRQSMIDAGLTRTTINERVQIIRAAFAWAVSRELLPPSIVEALRTVKGLRRGDSAAREPRKVRPVPETFVDAALPFMRPPVQAMVRLQLLTGARPGELCCMRTSDIDTAGDVWIYRPAEHKGDLRDISREIFIGPAAQDVLRPWLRPNLAEYVFSPARDDEARRAELAERRKTPIRYGNRPGSNRRRSPKRKPREHYTTTTYGRAVARACDAADAAAKARLAEALEPVPEGRIVPRWAVHQLRHSFATRVRREHGIELARVLLGHQSTATSEIYAEMDSGKARAVMARIG